MLIAALAHVPVDSPARNWYGPAVASFRVEFGGNPYDPAQNDVRVQFTGPEGAPIERLAYYDEEDHAWKAVLVAPVPGKYVAKLVRNGQPKTLAPREGILEIKDKTPGFYRIDVANPRRFRRDDQTPYIPLGFNLGWQNGNDIPMADQIAKMGKIGANWTRLWACHWDGKNPWWPQDDPTADKDGLWDPALVKWSKLVSACEANGVAFQMVLFHHGAFSSAVNPNWPDHPWNAKNGGFLKNAADFFTDPEAKRRSQIWLRYAVARFGHSPNLLAWELFNEVEWVDARYQNRWPDIEKWHGEMADYLRSIDPYGHLVTTSSAVDRPDLWTKMDYVQPHIYSPSVFAGIGGAAVPKEKPSFFGEFGADDMGKANARLVTRDGILGGLLANQSGPGQFWYWDLVEKENLYDEFQKAKDLIVQSGYADHASAQPIPVFATTQNLAAAVLVPGLGWGKTEKTAFSLPADLAAASKLSGYLQGLGGENRALFPEPLTISFDAAKPGTAKVVLSEISRRGASLEILLDGKEVARKAFPEGKENVSTSEAFSVPFPAGRHVITVRNSGQDWVKLGRIEVPGIAPEATATALADPRWMMIRVQSPAGAKSQSFDLVGLPLPDGEHTFRLFPFESGLNAPLTVRVRNGRATIPMVRDTVLVWTAPHP